MAKLEPAKALKLLKLLSKQHGLKVRWDKPFKKSIYTQFREAIPLEQMSSKLLYAAIRHHCKSRSYLRELSTGAKRYDIHGRWRGVVSEQEDKQAYAEIRQYHSRRKPKAEKPARPQRKPKPKRDNFHIPQLTLPKGDRDDRPKKQVEVRVKKRRTFRRSDD